MKNLHYSALLWIPALLLANTVWQAFCYGVAVGALQATEYYLEKYIEKEEGEALERDLESLHNDEPPP